MNRSNALAVHGRAVSMFNRCKATVAKVGAGAAALVASGASFASGGGDMGTVITDKISGAETTIQGILIVLVGVLALFVLYNLFKKVR